MRREAIGIDVGGTSITAAAFTTDGKQTTPVIPIPTSNISDLDSFLRTIEELVEGIRRTNSHIAAVGIATPGPYRHPDTSDRGTLPLDEMVVEAGNVPGLREGVVLGSLLAQHLPLPVALENDANVYALGEQRAGAARGHENVIGFIQGSGVGGAIIVDGRLLNGFDINAGEWGHLVVETDPENALPCSDIVDGVQATGHLEAQISGPALETVFGIKGELASLEIRAAMIERSVTYAGPVLATMVQSLGITSVVLCSGTGVGLGIEYAQAMQTFIERCTTKFRVKNGCQVATAQLGERAPLLGATAAAFDKVGIEMSTGKEFGR